MTHGHAAENIQNDLNADFDLVISLLDSASSIDRPKEEFSDQQEDVQPQVLIGLLQEYEELLQPARYPLGAVDIGGPVVEGTMR